MEKHQQKEEQEKKFKSNYTHLNSHWNKLKKGCEKSNNQKKEKTI